VLEFYWCRAWRKALGLTLDALSTKTGICRDTISKFENGRRVSYSTQQIISSTIIELRNGYFRTHSASSIKHLLNNKAFDRAMNIALNETHDSQ
jgi:transcriptional regulator with XRE-family HTH domain